MEILGSSLLFWSSIAVTSNLLYLYLNKKKIREWSYEVKILRFSIIGVISLSFIGSLIGGILANIS